MWEEAELPALQQRRGHQCLSHGQQNSLFKDCFGTNPKKSVGSRWATPVGLPNDCWCQWVPGTICCAELYHHISSMPQKGKCRATPQGASVSPNHRKLCRAKIDLIRIPLLISQFLCKELCSALHRPGGCGSCLHWELQTQTGKIHFPLTATSTN